MSKKIEVAECKNCPYREGGELYCLYGGGEKRLDDEKLFDPHNDNYIPEWCPLPDSKPYKWETAEQAKICTDTMFGFIHSDDPFTAGFNVARERK